MTDVSFGNLRQVQEFGDRNTKTQADRTTYVVAIVTMNYYILYGTLEEGYSSLQK